MLIVEDGSGRPDAECYVSVEDADAWLAARGYTLWATLTATEKEQAIRRAADYIERAYGQRWKGAKASAAQALSWPRIGVVVNDYALPSDAIARALVSANCLLAFKAASGDLQEDSGRPVVRETIGPLTTEYERGAGPGTRYLAIDAMLASLMRPNVLTLARA